MYLIIWIVIAIFLALVFNARMRSSLGLIADLGLSITGALGAILLVTVVELHGLADHLDNPFSYNWMNILIAAFGSLFCLFAVRAITSPRNGNGNGKR